MGFKRPEVQIFSLRPRKKGNEHSLPFLRGLSSVDVNQIFPKKTINRLKKITKNKCIIEERKNLVHVCNFVANLAEGIPLAGNGNISHSDQRFNIKEAGLKPCFFYVTLSPRRKCELPIPEVTRLRTN